MTPTPLAAAALLVAAISALVLPVEVAIALLVLVVAITIVDATIARAKVRVRRSVPRALSRAVPARLTVTTDALQPRRVLVRQAKPADVSIDAPVGVGGIETEIVAHRRGEA